MNINQYPIKITAYNSPEIIERILRVIRHRGFQLVNLNVAVNEEQLISINATLKSSKSISLLIEQLNKVVDVIKLEV